MSAPASVFISYAREDAAMKEALCRHLAGAAWSSDPDFVSWHDDRIEPGSAWDKKIKEELERAALVVFLLSPCLINSRYIREVEAPIAFDRRERAECQIITVMLDDVELRNTPFGSLHHVTQKPIASYRRH